MVIHCSVWNVESWLSIKRKYQLNTKGGVYTSFYEATPPHFQIWFVQSQMKTQNLVIRTRSICLIPNICNNSLFTVTQIVLIGCWSQLPVTTAKWCNSHEASREEEGGFFACPFLRLKHLSAEFTCLPLGIALLSVFPKYPLTFSGGSLTHGCNV